MTKKMVPALRKAVREYYEWHGDKHGSAERIVSRPGRFSRDYMVLAHVENDQGDKLSTMMDFTDWADGHYDVTEIYVFPREVEKEYLAAWRDEGREDVKLWKVQQEHMDEEDYGEDDGDLSEWEPGKEYLQEAETRRRKETCAACDDDYEESMIL
jgi:hypothetical protein